MTEKNQVLDNEDIEKSREIPSVVKRKKGGIVEKLIIGSVLTIALIALIAVNGGFSSSEIEKLENQNKPDTSKKVVNILGGAPDVPPPPHKKEELVEVEKIETMIQTYQAPPPPPPQTHSVFLQKSNGGKALPTVEERKLMSGLLIVEQGSNKNTVNSLTAEEQAQQIINAQNAQSGNASFMNFEGGGEDENIERVDGLSARLKATKIDGVKAGLLVDRDMFITTGSFLSCALETAISSDLAGMTSCRLTRDVYSTSGKVLLLEKGSRVTGQYQGGLKKGQARIFVLWNRVETPHGVMVSLDSIGTGALGRTGHSGFIDTHFWERFGGAMMLSLVDDIGGYLAAQLADSNSVNRLANTTSSAESAGAIALENSINIPPTLVKNQGDQISIFVARDLDFRGVYELKSKE